jgi:hypothetical protein
MIAVGKCVSYHVNLVSHANRSNSYAFLKEYKQPLTDFHQAIKLQTYYFGIYSQNSTLIINTNADKIL